MRTLEYSRPYAKIFKHLMICEQRLMFILCSLLCVVKDRYIYTHLICISVIIFWIVELLFYYHHRFRDWLFLFWYTPTLYYWLLFSRQPLNCLVYNTFSEMKYSYIDKYWNWPLDVIDQLQEQNFSNTNLNDGRWILRLVQSSTWIFVWQSMYQTMNECLTTTFTRW